MDEETKEQNRRRLRVIHGIPRSLSGREARKKSREISALGVSPISAARLQQLRMRAGASPTRDEAASLDSWRDFAERDTRRMQTQVDRLRPWVRRAVWANVIVWTVVIGLYIASHIDAIGVQLGLGQ